MRFLHQATKDILLVRVCCLYICEPYLELHQADKRRRESAREEGRDGENAEEGERERGTLSLTHTPTDGHTEVVIQAYPEFISNSKTRNGRLAFIETG
jgi:hypothetical protein